MSGEGAGSAPAVGPGWERVDGGGWVRRRHRASNPVDARVARALVVARERFIAPGGVGGARVPLEPGKKVLRASRLAWRAWGLGAGFSEADVEARAEETRAYAESLAGSGAPVDFERWAQAFRAVAQAHNARSLLARAMRLNADARDARECLRAFQDALGSRNEARKAERVSPEPAAALLAAARRTKQLARTPADLVVVERLLRGAASAASAASPPRAEDDAARAAREASETAARRAAKMELALLLCQEGRDDDARVVLSSAGFRYRLSRAALRYPADGDDDADADAGRSAPPKKRRAMMLGAGAEGVPKGGAEGALAAHAKYVRAFDGAVPAGALRHLRAAFGPESEFWTQHGYHREGCGFFSYVHRLTPRNADAGSAGVIGSNPTARASPSSTMDAVVRRVWTVAAAAFPAAAEATAAEWWAHCRPHAAGHQMHFDSDDEGKGGVIRHPICSAVVFVTGGVGGPTLVTNQTDASKRLADAGWLVGPREGRICVFDGDMLHGVLPGRGICPANADDADESADPRRITLMIAFWRDVETRGSAGGDAGSFPKGSARPFPNPRAYADEPGCPPGTSWPDLFHPDGLGALETEDDDEGWRRREVVATPVGAVWEDVDREKNEACMPSLAVDKIRSLPKYDACFMF